MTHFVMLGVSVSNSDVNVRLTTYSGQSISYRSAIFFILSFSNRSRELDMQLNWNVI